MSKLLYPGDLVDDFYGARVPIDLLLKRGIKASAEYLKAWDDGYTQQLRDVGIAPIAIGEQGAEDALQGAARGVKNGLLWCALADHHAYPLDDPVGIIVCHDTGKYNNNVPLYFKACEDVIRSRGRNMSGYIMKNPANACMAVGVTFEVIWATAALSWGGGAHPQSHVQQKPSSLFPGTNMSVDMGVVLRPFPVWSSTPPPIPTQPPTPSEEDDVSDIVTNAEQLYDNAPQTWKAVVTSSGKLRHLELPEWHARGSQAGTPLSNADIAALGTV